jgi:DNA-binding response OmpR family regulator
MARILVAEDDEALNALTIDYLKDYGYEAVGFFNGLDAYNAFKTGDFDVIVSDVMMPKMDGFALVEKIRGEDKDIPILFMTARDDKFSKQLGFKLGVDDYLVKPFDMDELALRVGAILRRVKTEADNALTVGNLKMDKEEHTAYVDGEELALTVREFDILFKLLSNPKKTFTRSKLMDEFWDYDSSATSRTVDVYIVKIREKTSACNGFEIVTVHGLGYKAVLK